MDAKTALEILRSEVVDYEPKIMGTKPISIRRCNDIAEFIEQQAEQIEKMKHCRNCSEVVVICNPVCSKCREFKSWKWDGGSGE